MRTIGCLGLLLLAVFVRDIPAQTGAESFSRKNSFTFVSEYSNDSSRIILGNTPNRKMAALGGQYERRLLLRPKLGLAYVIEARPFILASDVTLTAHVTVTDSLGTPPKSFDFTDTVKECHKGTTVHRGTNPDTGVVYTTSRLQSCGRIHTFAQGFSPIGLRLNVIPRRALQLTLSSNGGYLFSNKPIPIPSAGSFNFTFEFGGGLEYFRSRNRSMRMEYVVQHYSNHDTAPVNPGVDNGFIKLTYAFGR